MTVKRFTGVLIATLGLTAGAQAAEQEDDRRFNADVLVPSFGFGQFNSGVGFTTDGDRYMLFGGRGGTYRGDSDRWYTGGGGRGGFSIDDGDGGLGYGFAQFGNRGPITSDQTLGLDAYTGLAFGGYGSESDGGNILGPVAGTALYLGANRSFEYGLHGEMVANVLDFDQSVFTLGIMIGGKSGNVTIPWESRDNLYQ